MLKASVLIECRTPLKHSFLRDLALWSTGDLSSKKRSEVLFKLFSLSHLTATYTSVVKRLLLTTEATVIRHLKEGLL